MLTETQLERVSAAVNKRIDLPLLGERREAKLFTAALRRLDREMEQALTAELGEATTGLIRELLDERSSAEVRRNALERLIRTHLTDPLVTSLNTRLDLPFLSEDQEETLLALALDQVVDVAVGAVLDALPDDGSRS